MIDRRIMTALVFGAVSAYACGGRTVTTSDATVAAECGAFATGMQTLLSCGSAPLPQAVLDEQRSQLVGQCSLLDALPGSSFAKSAKACADALEGWGCNLELPWACQWFAPGTLAAGASCAEAGQCESNRCIGGAACANWACPGATTQIAGMATASVCGTCAAVGNVGDPCFSGGYGACAAGASCGGASFVCIATPSGAEGSRCDGVTAPCDPGLVCSSTSSTCEPPLTEGESCSSSGDCAAGLDCIATTCAKPRHVGAPCNETGPSDCAPGLVCDLSTGACATLTWAEPGEPCGATAACLRGSCPASGTATGTCPAALQAGQPCGPSNDACDDGLLCVDLVCAVPPSLPMCN
jgi:hypothetical protein